jgi:2,4-dienoyl-CoA reductase-like NADH-dependent reductase (Old Yellow Enzyme family)
VAQLLAPLRIRELELRNRIVLSPMCQYSAEHGLAQPWHLVHLGARAVGGAGLVLVEATAVSPEGRISPQDLGLWSDEQADALRPIAAFIKGQGAAPGIQLAHAGRKAGTAAPWNGGAPLPLDKGGWQPVGPSPLAFAPGFQTPRELTREDLERLIEQFVFATKASLRAGFEVVEVHAAHGYLLHQFLSPLSNQRLDELGGSLAGRMRFPLRVVEAVRAAWPQRLPLFVRISATDWVEGGWTLDDSVVFARELERRGVDLIDCSSGGSAAHAKIDVAPGFQVPFAARIRREAGIMTAAVGMITDGPQAEAILRAGDADAICIGRAFLRDPNWARTASIALGQPMAKAPQYARA